MYILYFLFFLIIKSFNAFFSFCFLFPTRLFEVGVDVFAENVGGKTPLQVAEELGKGNKDYDEICKFLNDAS